jgi:hypothetical protein
MAIPRYSLYRTPSEWASDIQETPTGQWVKWNDVSNYIIYALDHGFAPIIVEISPTITQFLIDEQNIKAEIDEEDNWIHTDPLFEDESDVYDMITKQAKERFDE